MCVSQSCYISLSCLAVSIFLFFEDSVSQLKKSKCFMLTKKNASLAFSQSPISTPPPPFFHCVFSYLPFTAPTIVACFISVFMSSSFSFFFFFAFPFTDGDAGDSFSFESGSKFSTVDQDNDKFKKGHCAKTFKSGWWHAVCHKASLNGLYLNGSDTDPAHYAAGITWHSWTGYKYFLTKSEMKIRP